MRSIAAISGVLVFGAAANAGLVNLIVDYSLFDGVHAVVDGVNGGFGEYDISHIPVPSATGGGGGLDGPGAGLYFNLNGPLTVGFQPGGALDHTVIILVRASSGGRARGSGGGVVALNDSTDAARRALSSLQGQYPWPSGSGVGAAITINSDGFGFFLFPDNQHSTFTQVGSYTGMVGAGGFREAQFPGIGITPSFAVVYAGEGVLYNESIPLQPYTGGANPGQQIGAASPTDIPNYNQIQQFIPAPESFVIVGGVGALGLRRRRV